MGGREKSATHETHEESSRCSGKQAGKTALLAHGEGRTCTMAPSGDSRQPQCTLGRMGENRFWILTPASSLTT